MSAPKHIIKRDGRKVPFTRIRIVNAIYRAAVAVGGRDRALSESLADKAVRSLSLREAGSDPTVEEIQDTVEKVLIENGHARTAKAYILYRSERAALREGRTDASSGKEPIPWEKIWRILNWAIDHEVESLEKLNSRIESGTFPDLVVESEDAYHMDIARAAERILERGSEIRVVIVAGPSSSGKTSTTRKISRYLAGEGFSFVPFHVDNYFFDLDLQPEDEYGDHDYETPQAMDLPMINDHLKRLLSGETVRVPVFDFPSGKRIDEAEEMRLDKNEILLIDSLHGLYGPMTEGIPDNAGFRIYTETLLQMRGPDGRYIRWTDLRLLRRMMRDERERGMDPERTLEHWHYVRDSELRHIIPFANSVDYIVNGALPYELPFMRPYFLDRFCRWAEKYKEIEERRDSHRRASRVMRLLETVLPYEDDSIVPSGSLFREFLGGQRIQ